MEFRRHRKRFFFRPKTFFFETDGHSPGRVGFVDLQKGFSLDQKRFFFSQMVTFQEKVFFPLKNMFFFSRHPFLEGSGLKSEEREPRKNCVHF